MTANGAHLPAGPSAHSWVGITQEARSRSDAELGNQEMRSMGYLVACRRRSIQAQSCWSILRGPNRGPSERQRAVSKETACAVDSSFLVHYLQTFKAASKTKPNSYS